MEFSKEELDLLMESITDSLSLIEELNIYSETDRSGTLHWSAQQRCRIIGARKIKDERSKALNALEEKLMVEKRRIMVANER